MHTAKHKARGPHLQHLDCAWCTNWHCCMKHDLDPTQHVTYSVGDRTWHFCNEAHFYEWFTDALNP